MSVVQLRSVLPQSSETVCRPAKVYCRNGREWCCYSENLRRSEGPKSGQFHQTRPRLLEFRRETRRPIETMRLFHKAVLTSSPDTRFQIRTVLSSLAVATQRELVEILTA